MYMNNTQEERLISITQATKLLGVCKNTLREWDRTGKFVAIKTMGGHRRYKLSEVNKILGEQ